MITNEQKILEKLRTLPPRRQAEVEDIIDFLRDREAMMRHNLAAATVSEPVFRTIRDNPDDADYDHT